MSSKLWSGSGPLTLFLLCILSTLPLGYSVYKDYDHIYMDGSQLFYFTHEVMYNYGFRHFHLDALIQLQVKNKPIFHKSPFPSSYRSILITPYHIGF